MPAAIDRATYVAFSEATGLISTLVACDYDEELTFTDISIDKKMQADSRPLPDWGLYPAGVARVLQDRELPAIPVNAVFASDVPRGAGLSSSASVEVAFLTMWQHLSGDRLGEMDRALLCQQAENQYVGVNCGIMDQFASVCGAEEKILQLDCRSLEWEQMRLPGKVTIIIADTLVRRKLGSSEYNQRRRDCEEAVRIMKAELPSITSLRNVSLDAFEFLCSHLPPRVENRTRHVVEEIARTKQAKQCLAGEDVIGFGRLMNACHTSLRELYQVSSLELDALVVSAQSLDGCYGARLTGAGFGGCTVNLVDLDEVDPFVKGLKQGYFGRTGVEPEVYVTRPSAGAGIVW